MLEECLVGEELSYFVIADGERFVACGSAQDHKRLLDGDLGPNTGGMGAFAPSVLLTETLAARIEREIVAADARRRWPRRARPSAGSSIAG